MPAYVECDYGQYGQVVLEEVGHPRIEVPAGERVNIVERLQRLQRKVEYYNQVLNTHLTARINPKVQDIAISDNVIQVGSRELRNEDYQLLHECAHHKQMVLLGFKTTRDLVNSFTQGLTPSQLGARDWVMKYTMPPFVVSREDKPTIFGYYQGELRTSLARGIRDIHSDVVALRNRGKIYLTEEEKEERLDPEQKFLSQFQDELKANIPNYDYSEVRDPEPDFIRKIARFRAVAGGAAQLFGDDYFLTGEQYDDDMRKVFGETSLQYQVYRALSDAYQTYFINCTCKTDLIAFHQILNGLDSPNPLIRARVADFLGETGDVKILSPLMERINREKDDFAKWNMLSALADVAGRHLETEEGWEAVEYLYAFEEDVFIRTMRAIHENKTDIQRECSVRQQLLDLLQDTPKARVREIFHMLLSLDSRLPQVDKVLEDIALKHPDEAVETMAEIVNWWQGLWKRMPESKTVRTWYRRGANEKKTPLEEQMDAVKRSFSILIYSVSRICKNVLWETHPDRALDLMEALLTFPVEGNRASTLLDIGNAGFKRPDRALDILERYLASENPKVRDWGLHSVIVLGFTRPERVLHILENASSDKESYFDPPDFHGNIGSTAITGIAKLWGVAQEEVSGIMNKFALNSDPYYRASVLDAVSEVLSIPQGERLHDILRVDEKSAKEEIVKEHGSELLNIVESLVTDSNPSIRFGAVGVLKAFTKKEPEGVYNILIGRKSEGNPTVLGGVISAIGEYAEIDSGKSLSLLEDLVNMNPLAGCHAGVQQAMAATLRQIVKHGGDAVKVLDYTVEWEGNANKFYVSGNEELVERKLREAIVPDKDMAEIIGPRSTTDYLIRDEIESLAMEGKVRPIAGIKFPEDKLGIARVDVSRGFIRTIGVVGKSDSTMSEECILILWDLFKSREPPVMQGVVEEMGEIGTVNPDYALHFLKPMVNVDNPFLKECGLRAINKFADQRSGEVLEIARSLMGIPEKDLKVVLADTYKMTGKARPEESVLLLTELLTEADSSIIWHTTESLFKIATPEQLNAIYNNPAISNDARAKLRNHLGRISSS